MLTLKTKSRSADLRNRLALPISAALFAALVVSLVVLLAGCSSSENAAPEDASSDSTATSAAKGALSIDIFSARGFLGGSEYERYYLTGNLLWRECGSISSGGKKGAKSGLEGDQVLSNDPQLQIQERRVEKLSREQTNLLRTQASAIITGAKQSEKRSEPAPGSVFSLGDPGLFEMMVAVGADKQRIISSVDAVADNKTALLEKAHTLFAKLRGVGPQICGSATFYGIERQAL